MKLRYSFFLTSPNFLAKKLHFTAFFCDFICFFDKKVVILHPNLKIMEKTQERTQASELLERNVKKIVRENNYSWSRPGDIRSLAQLAKSMGISAPSLTHALKGNPQLDTIQKIADALRVPVMELFTGSEGIEGYITTPWKTHHFYSVEELQNALDPLRFRIEKK